MNDEQFAESLQREGYDLIIMQFGGNGVPYLKDEAHAGRFARALGRHEVYSAIVSKGGNTVYWTL